MPRNFEFPRARGGRGPQIGPGTFDGRSAPDGVKQDRFDAIVWSAGPEIPGTELWCFHTSFDPVVYIIGQTHSIFLDKVPDASAFTPPLGSPPTSISTCIALRTYARNRLFDLHQVLGHEDDWTVQVARPEPIATSATLRKLDDGLYRVTQHDRPAGDIPIAWVWVRDSSSREIWLFLHPNQADGFHFVGTQPVGSQQLYESTEVRFTPIPLPGFPWGGTYMQSITKFKEAVKDNENPLILDLDELVLHDLHIDEMPNL